MLICYKKTSKVPYGQNADVEKKTYKWAFLHLLACSHIKKAYWGGKKKSAKCFQILGLEIAFLMLFLLWTKHKTIKLGSSLPDGLNFLNYLHGNIKLKFRKKRQLSH